MAGTGSRLNHRLSHRPLPRSTVSTLWTNLRQVGDSLMANTGVTTDTDMGLSAGKRAPLPRLRRSTQTAPAPRRISTQPLGANRVPRRRDVSSQSGVDGEPDSTGGDPKIDLTWEDVPPADNGALHQSPAMMSAYSAIPPGLGLCSRNDIGRLLEPARRRSNRRSDLAKTTAFRRSIDGSSAGDHPAEAGYYGCRSTMANPNQRIPDNGSRHGFYKGACRTPCGLRDTDKDTDPFNWGSSARPDTDGCGGPTMTA